MQTFIKLTSGALIAALGLSGAGFAQTSTNRVDANQDWAVFFESEPDKTCWITSAPTKTENSKAGVTRGEIQLFVTFWPGSATPEVSFTGGYPFKPGSKVKVQIGSDVYNLDVEGETAWPSSAADDARLRDAMKAGASALVTGESSRGTVTKDTFSLSGFTAALQSAEQNCT